ncbi:MAG TPA: hypothetical protein VGY54_01870 [Polyangiaceae bacterium]|nr:hypothetical protein [Polyangiaceae bacterium]
MQRLARLAACALSTMMVLGTTRTSHAAASARLVYVRGPGAEQCPTEEAVHAAVRSRLGYDPFIAWAHDTLFAEVTRTAGAYRTRVKLVDDTNTERGAREMSVPGDDCAAVIEAIGLTISLTIDPNSLIGPPQSQPAPPPQAETEAEAELTPAQRAPPVHETPAPSPPPQPHALSVHMSLGLIGSLGTAPTATAGATFSVGAGWRALTLDLEGRADLPASGASERPPAQVRSWLLAGAIVPCLHVGPFFGCGVASVGDQGATAAGIQMRREDHAAWWAAGGRAGTEFSLSNPLFLRAYAEVLGTLARNMLFIDGQQAYRFPPWSGGVGFSLAWRF